MTTPTTPATPALEKQYDSTSVLKVLTRAVASLRGGQAALDAAAAGVETELDDERKQADDELTAAKDRERKRQANEDKRRKRQADQPAAPPA